MGSIPGYAEEWAVTGRVLSCYRSWAFVLFDSDSQKKEQKMVHLLSSLIVRRLFFMEKDNARVGKIV